MSGTGKVQDEFRLSPAKKQVLIVMGTCPKEKLQGAPAIQIWDVFSVNKNDDNS